MPSSETGIPFPYDPYDLPSGLDRADGTASLGNPDVKKLGTPSEADQINATSHGGSGVDKVPVEEEPDSPVIELAEQDTITHRFRIPWNEALTRGLAHRRGQIRTDGDEPPNYTKLLSCTIQRAKGGMATVHTVAEAMNGDTPPDLFECVPVELGLHIFKHPRYLRSFLGDPTIPNTLITGDTVGGYGSLTEAKNQMVLRLLQDYMENTTAAWRAALSDLLRNSLNSNDGVPTTSQPPKPTSVAGKEVVFASTAKVCGTDMAKAAAMEIIQKYWRGEETPSIVGFQITWTEFSWLPRHLNPGGYAEDPMTEGGLPPYFWDTTWPPSESSVSNIFDYMAKWNPACYSSTGHYSGTTSISWRRESDQIVRERTFFAIQHRWAGSPIGHWDPHLYNRYDAPHKKENYVPPSTAAGAPFWTYEATGSA